MAYLQYKILSNKLKGIILFGLEKRLVKFTEGVTRNIISERITKQPNKYDKIIHRG